MWGEEFSGEPLSALHGLGCLFKTIISFWSPTMLKGRYNDL